MKKQHPHHTDTTTQPSLLHFVGNNKLTSFPRSLQDEALDLLDEFYFESKWCCANSQGGCTLLCHCFVSFFQILFCIFVGFVFTAASTDPTHLFLLQPSANDCFFSLPPPFSPARHRLSLVVLCNSLVGWVGLCLSLDHSVWLQQRSGRSSVETNGYERVTWWMPGARRDFTSHLMNWQTDP